MHSFLRAIGFSKIKNRKELNKLLYSIVNNPDVKSVSEDSNENILAEFRKDFGDFIGIAVRGEYREDEGFEIDYYYPYFFGNGISTKERIDVEKHAEKESYAGVCDEIKIGVTLIFYLQNVIEYLNWKKMKNNNREHSGTTLSALSTKGKVILPIRKDKSQISKNEKLLNNRNHLIAAARDGDEEAIESLTLEDIDTYSMLSRRIVNEDVLSIVDTYFMPYGIESDQYSIMGEILDYNKIENEITNEEIYLLKVNSNDLVFDICINKLDLLGEPDIGRRFKGNIWMQGSINYQE